MSVTRIRAYIGPGNKDMFLSRVFGRTTPSHSASRQRALPRAIRVAALVGLLALGILGQPLQTPQAGTSQRGPRPEVSLSTESPGWDQALAAVLSAFDKADVVALAASRGIAGSELRLRLIRHPDFPNKARFIVVEWANSLYQPILDRYIQGENVPLTELQRVWRDQTQVGSWDSPIHAEFFTAVREINEKLPKAKQLRVLGGDPPIDWSKVHSRAEYGLFADGERRDDSLVMIVRDQVLRGHGKALVIYGGAHFGGLQQSNPGRVFVVNILGGSGPGYESLDKTLHSEQRPVLLSLRGTPAGNLAANQFSWGARRFVQGKEVPLFPPTTTLGDLADACFYFGHSVDVSGQDPEPDPAIYAGTPYGAEILRRRQILNTKR